MFEHWNDEDEDEKKAYKEYLDKKYALDDFATLAEIKTKSEQREMEEHLHYTKRKI
jgi:hypothetical protein